MMEECAVIGTEPGLTDWHCHHRNPYHLSKDDRFSNLIVLHEVVHRLIHLKDIEKIKAILNSLQLDHKQKRKVNEL
jgi:RNA-directed DNA polymerase